MKVLSIGGGGYAWEAKEKVENGMAVIIREVNKCYDLQHFLKQESSIAVKLEQLKISECSHLINLVPSSSSFQNLTTLVVSYCKGLKNVLTSSTTKTLVRLREMKISGCNMITEIVADDDDAAKDEIIVFNEMKKLTLSYLKSLTSFCSGSCAFRFPSLEILVVDDCHNMKIFSRGELSTPVLLRVQLKTWDKEQSAWKDDLNTTIQQVNLKKESFLKKPREGLQSQLFLPSAPVSSLNLQTKLEIFPAMVAAVWSDDNGLQLEAIDQFRKLLSAETSPQIEEVIQSGIVPRFVEFLMREDYPRLQYKAARALSNVASGNSENTKVVIDHGAVPILVKLLASSSDDVREQAVWALANVAGDSPACRDLVLSEEALIPLLAQVSPALPALAQLVHSNDKEVMTDACWALSYLSDGTNEKIQAVIEAESIKKVVSWIISNITAGNREQIQAVIDAGLIGPIVNLLENAEFDTKKEAAWVISNATSGVTHEQIKCLVTEGCVKPLCDLLQCADPKIVTVCLRGLENILKVGEAEKNMDTAIGDVNQYAQLVEEAEGLEKIENLQSHDNDEIHEKSVTILETYWRGRVVGPQLGLLYVGDEEEDALGSNVITNAINLCVLDPDNNDLHPACKKEFLDMSVFERTGVVEFKEGRFQFTEPGPTQLPKKLYARSGAASDDEFDDDSAAPPTIPSTSAPPLSSQLEKIEHKLNKMEQNLAAYFESVGFTPPFPPSP
ncbi:Importin subunit alpha-1a [Citrus sinensis]|nr:Importin subunit alpha-1a [Citrus sinensis]